MLDTVKPTPTPVQIVPGLIRYIWVIPKELLKLERSNTYNYVLERWREYTGGVPQATLFSVSILQFFF